MDRQSFESRLLNVEQEAMENMILVRQVLDTLQARYVATLQSSK